MAVDTKTSKMFNGINGLTDQQKLFVMYLLESDSFNATKAAERAGYKYPSHAALRLLKKRPIKLALGKACREREARSQLKADDVLNFLRVGIFFNPLSLFEESEDGSWFIRDKRDIPEEVGRLIESIELATITKPNGNVISGFKVKLISKSILLPLAMKHLGLFAPQELNHKHSFAWSALYGRPPQDEPDPVEARISEVKRLAAPRETIIDVPSR